MKDRVENALSRPAIRQTLKILLGIPDEAGNVQRRHIAARKRVADRAARGHLVPLAVAAGGVPAVLPAAYRPGMTSPPSVRTCMYLLIFRPLRMAEMR